MAQELATTLSSQFLDFYYKNLGNAAELTGVFTSDSYATFDSNKPETFNSPEEIIKKILDNSSKGSFVPTSYTAQPGNNSIAIMVSGEIRMEGQQYGLPFSEFFVLDLTIVENQVTGMKIRNLFWKAL